MTPTEICIGALREAFPDVPVTSELPFELPGGPMIQVSQTGGQDDGFVARPLMQLLVWGVSDPEANSLAISAVNAIVQQALVDDLLSHAECTEMSRDEWALNGEARYRVQMKLTVNS